MLMKWFIAGFAVSIALSSVWDEAFAGATASTVEYRRELNRVAQECKIAQPEWNQCLDQTQSPIKHAKYLKFVDGGLEKLTDALRARGVSQLLFVSSRHLNCTLSSEVLRTHPDAVGFQILLAEALERRSQGETAPTEIRIETVPADLLDQGIQKRIEMQGGALVLRAAFGSCSTLETDAQETGARSVLLGYDLGRKLFRTQSR